jgi:hypothetical protein
MRAVVVRVVVRPAPPRSGVTGSLRRRTLQSEEASNGRSRERS